MTGLRTYALFDPATGLAEMTMALCVLKGDLADAPDPGTLTVGERSFHVHDMTAHRADWCRLHIEATGQGGQGRPTSLTITGGKAHHKHPHIRTGATHAWASAPRPAVAVAAHALSGLDDHALIAHLTGLPPEK